MPAVLRFIDSAWVAPLALGLLAIAGPASAAVTVATSRAALQADTLVDWSLLGPDQTALPGSFTLGDVAVSGAPAFSAFTGDTYTSDFDPSDTVLALFDLNAFEPVRGVFNISFATAVRAAGAQVQSFLFGDFAGSLSAYDATNTLLGATAFIGTNSGSADGSAVFAGLISDAVNIRRIEFSVPDGAAINQLSVTSAVPEPSSWLLLAAGIAAVGAARRRQRATGSAPGVAPDAH